MNRVLAASPAARVSSFAAAAGAYPGDEVPDDLACAGPGVEIDVDVPLRHLGWWEMVLAVEPDPELLDLVRTANLDPLARRLGVGIELAAALVGDGVGATRPVVRQELLEIILEAFALPPLPFSMSKSLDVLAGERPVFKTLIFNQLERARQTTVPDRVASAHHILASIAVGGGH